MCDWDHKEERFEKWSQCSLQNGILPTNELITVTVGASVFYIQCLQPLLRHLFCLLPRGSEEDNCSIKQMTESVTMTDDVTESCCEWAVSASVSWKQELATILGWLYPKTSFQLLYLLRPLAMHSWRMKLIGESGVEKLKEQTHTRIHTYPYRQILLPRELDDSGNKHFISCPCSLWHQTEFLTS